MSHHKVLRTLLAVGFLALSLTACLGSEQKTLGKKTQGGTGTGSTDADSFAITLAYRDGASTDATVLRTVSLQGSRGVPSANLVNICGATGNTCVCQFYKSTSDTNPIASVSAGISSQNNSFSCTMHSSINPADYNLVQIKSTSTTAKQSSGLINIKTTLTIDDILGNNLSKTKVRGIYRYECTRTFFEGEGVSASQITCTPGQHLGVITAKYNFYVYRSSTASNQKGGDTAFPSDICKRNSWLKVSCSMSQPDLRYGFYEEPKEPFLVGIQMTRAPEAAQGDTAPLSETYGYAALPDSAGNCPTGLIKIRPWQAQPASIVQGSLGSNPPSSYINNGSLNNTVVEVAAPANFQVSRQPNQTPCADSTSTNPAPGDCTNAAFGGTTVAQSVSYTGLTPVVCVIPPNLITGLF